MRLWTFQPIGTVAKIKSEGTFRTDHTMSDPDYTEAYHWLADQMVEKGITKPEGVIFPVWAWYAYEGEHKKPDMRKPMFSGFKNSELIELEIPDEKVLLSDYDKWHYVLNDSWYDDSRNIEEWESMTAWFDRQPYHKRAEMKRESWKKIFNLTKIDTEWERSGFYIQATFWEIKPEYIVSMRKV